jgi:uncharacterized damage-inducible protein DinB
VVAGECIMARMNIQELFLKQKEAMRARTRQVTSLLREEHMAWRPVPGALPVGEMLRHMWVSEERVRAAALQGDFSYYEERIPNGLAAVVGTPRTLKEELADLERVHGETLKLVADFPLERWEEVRVHEALGIHRKVAVMLFGISEHEVHHRAQLMTYLRMLGTPVPEPFAKR